MSSRHQLEKQVSCCSLTPPTHSKLTHPHVSPTTVSKSTSPRAPHCQQGNAPRALPPPLRAALATHLTSPVPHLYPEGLSTPSSHTVVAFVG